MILAIFQASGNDDTVIKELMIWVSGPAMYSATILRYLDGSWSGPVDVSDRIPLISRRTSLRVTCRRWNAASSLTLGCSESTKISRSSLTSISPFPVNFNFNDS